MAFGYNTVANTANIAELEAVRDIVEADGAVEWQVFEFDLDGPNPTNQKPKLKLAPGQFAEATQGLIATREGLKITCKSLATRTGIYFLVDDSGIAWKPAGEGMRTVMGHITHDRDKVMTALRRHIEELRQK